MIKGQGAHEVSIKSSHFPYSSQCSSVSIKMKFETLQKQGLPILSALKTVKFSDSNLPVDKVFLCLK